MVFRHHLALLHDQAHDPSASHPPATDATSPASPSTKESTQSTPKTNSSTGSTSPTPSSSSTSSAGSASTKSAAQSPPPSNPKVSTTTSPSSNLTSPSDSPSAISTSPTPLPISNSTKSSTPVSSTPNNSTNKTSSTPPPPPVQSNTTSAPSNKSLTTSPSSKSTSSSNSNGRFLGIEVSLLIHLAIILVVIAIIILIIWIIYRRYQTKKEYNDSPQNFAHKPNLTFIEEYYLKHDKLEKCLTPEHITIEQQNPINGKIYKVQFKGTDKSAVFFHRRQPTTAYFEVEVLQANGSVEIGYIPKSVQQKFNAGEEYIGSHGVGVTNTGFVHAEGENIYNYSWNLAYGDVFGIGLTKQTTKFAERRAWISKNGVLLNRPPNDEMDRWLATIEIPAQEKNNYNLGKKEDQEQKEGEEKDETKKKEQEERNKIENLLKKQRISLKTFNAFEYLPVILCHGNKDDNKSTIINVNVGGQIFRMYDEKFRSGLLKDKPLFGED